jgi:hypothetical protein
MAPEEVAAAVVEAVVDAANGEAAATTMRVVKRLAGHPPPHRCAGRTCA